MRRLVAFVSGCSFFIVASWLLVGNHDASRVSRSNQFSVVPRRDNREGDNGVRRVPLPGDENRGLVGGPMAKKKAGIRGVAVDRANVIETVTLEDLQAPQGRLWIPAALSGRIEHNSPNPLFNVLVAYCQLDMAAYHDTPWLFAMGTFHQRQSGCLDDKSLVRTYRLPSLMVSMQHPAQSVKSTTSTVIAFLFWTACSRQGTRRATVNASIICSRERYDLFRQHVVSGLKITTAAVCSCCWL